MGNLHVLIGVVAHQSGAPRRKIFGCGENRGICI